MREKTGNEDYKETISGDPKSSSLLAGKERQQLFNKKQIILTKIIRFCFLFFLNKWKTGFWYCNPLA